MLVSLMQENTLIHTFIPDLLRSGIVDLLAPQKRGSERGSSPCDPTALVLELHDENDVVIRISPVYLTAKATRRRAGCAADLAPAVKQHASCPLRVAEKCADGPARGTFIIDSQGVVQKIFQVQEALDSSHALVVYSLM
jgi:hypothetical protein